MSAGGLASRLCRTEAAARARSRHGHASSVKSRAENPTLQWGDLSSPMGKGLVKGLVEWDTGGGRNP
eukprot:9488330-Pyramimonas_sp.AAC.2